MRNPTKCVSKADKALYEAKNSNRNCVKVFNTQEESVAYSVVFTLPKLQTLG
jgi:predicted signal transduction protein with EAL and GGDEF domain